MGSAGSDTENNELLRLLDEFSTLLRTWGEDRWAARIDRDRRLIADDHPDAFAHLLTAFIGVGSLADLEIRPANGHSIAEDKVRPVNDRLRLLRGAIITKVGDGRASTSPDQ